MMTVWTEWGSLTRFLESARLAFARERSLWGSLEITDLDAVTITSTTGRRRYEVSLRKHVAAVDDEVTLYASVLIHSYALTESAACQRLGLDSRAAGGIESWGHRFLGANGREWTHVSDGMAGAVEVAVVRNAFAHGARSIDVRGAQRLGAAGSPKRCVGDAVSLAYDELCTYRGRLRSLLNCGGISP